MTLDQRIAASLDRQLEVGSSLRPKEIRVVDRTDGKALDVVDQVVEIDRATAEAMDDQALDGLVMDGVRGAYFSSGPLIQL